MRWLTFGGGGAFGVVFPQILKDAKFDLSKVEAYAGVSAGALLAAGLATGLTLEDVLNQSAALLRQTFLTETPEPKEADESGIWNTVKKAVEGMGDEVKEKLDTVSSLFVPPYSIEATVEWLATLGRLKKPIAYSWTDTSGQFHWKRQRAGETPHVRKIAASCQAPFFFKEAGDPDLNPNGWLDGGLSCNDAAPLAYLADNDLKTLDVLAFDSGFSAVVEGGVALNAMWALHMAPLCLSCSAQFADAMLQKLGISMARISLGRVESELDDVEGALAFKDDYPKRYAEAVKVAAAYSAFWAERKVVPMTMFSTETGEDTR